MVLEAFVTLSRIASLAREYIYYCIPSISELPQTRMSSAAERPHVLILGAGLGGLTLAQALRKQGVSFEIFERDAGLHSRFQGWAIALHKFVMTAHQILGTHKI